MLIKTLMLIYLSTNMGKRIRVWEGFGYIYEFKIISLGVQHILALKLSC